MKYFFRTLLTCILFCSVNSFAQLPSVIFNEINYNSAPEADAEDWVEIYNRSGSDVDISGWVLKDSNDDNGFVIPSGTVLGTGEYLVLVTDSAAFRGNHPNVIHFIGAVDFKFSNGGELLRLYDSGGELIDDVEYDDEGDWPSEADGDGPTLELIDPDKDNNAPANWGSSTQNYGTPGEENSIISTSIDRSEEVPDNFVLSQNYPNPFNPSTVISYQLPVNSLVSLKVFDMLGREVSVLVDGMQSAGLHMVEFNASNIPSGIYIYRLEAGNTSLTRRMTLLK